MPFIHPDSAIIDLQVMSPFTVEAGYAVNIRPNLMASDLQPFVIETPRSPWARWHDDVPDPAPVLLGENGRINFAATAAAQIGWRPQYRMVCLLFPSAAAARATSLGEWWVNFGYRA